VSALPQESDFDLFSNREGIVDIDSQVADRALDLGVAKQELNGSKITRPPIDQSRLGPS